MPSEKQALERKENIALILEYLRVHGPKSRRELSAELQLSWGCISELVSILLERGILLEGIIENTGRKGRIPSVLSLNDRICFLGVDINRMGLKAAVCNLCGQKTAQYSGEIAFSSKEALMDSVSDFISDVREKHSNLFGIGFAMQGIHDEKEDVWSFPSEECIIIDFNKDFGDKLDIPFMVEHDPDCILYGSLNHESGSNKMVLRLDRGIGATVYKEKAIARNNAMEIGYMVINEQGDRLHDVVSLSAIEKQCGINLHGKKEHIGGCAEGRVTLKHAEVGTTLEHAEERENFARAEVREAFERAGRFLGIALGNICNLLNLDEILLCGEMVQYYEWFVDSLDIYYKKTVLPMQEARISAIHITDAAFGAAKMIMERYIG